MAIDGLFSGIVSAFRMVNKELSMVGRGSTNIVVYPAVGNSSQDDNN